MSADTEDDVVEIVEVFPKSTGALVMSVKSPPSVTPSKQIWVVDAVLHTWLVFIGWAALCQTANVPVSEVLWTAM